MDRVKRIALYPGTFDPVTLGHLDVIKISAKIFDRVVVGILNNPRKSPMFSAAERSVMICDSLEACGIKNVKIIISSDKLAVELAKEKGAVAIIRGLRLTTEYEAELNISFNNRTLSESVSTIFVAPCQEHIHISSSAVRELLLFKKYEMLYKYLPEAVIDFIRNRGKE